MQLILKRKYVLQLGVTIILFMVGGWLGFFASIVTGKLAPLLLFFGLTRPLFLVLFLVLFQLQGFRSWPDLANLLEKKAIRVFQAAVGVWRVVRQLSLARLGMAFFRRLLRLPPMAWKPRPAVFGILAVVALCWSFSSGVAVRGGSNLMDTAQPVPLMLNFMGWWFGGLLRVGALSPTFVMWLKARRRSWQVARFLEALTLCLLLLLICGALFSRVHIGGIPTSALVFLFFPFHYWATLRFGLSGLLFSILLMAVSGIWAIEDGRGIFSNMSVAAAVVLSSIYMVFVAGGGLFLRHVLNKGWKLAKTSKVREKHYQSIFENSVLPLCEEDWHKVKEFLTQLSADGVSDVRGYFAANPNKLVECLLQVRLVEANQALLDLLKVTDWEEMKDDLVKFVAPESLPVLSELLVALARGETRFRGDEQLITADGERIHVVFDFNCMQGFEHSLKRVVYTCTDVTEAKLSYERAQKAEAEMRKAKEDAEKANSSKSLFLANMSHEIRTPVSVMVGYSELLKDHSLTSDERKNLVTTIVRNGNHLLQLIDDILDLSRVEAQCLKIERLSFDLDLYLQELKGSLNQQAFARGISFVFNCHPSLPQMIICDPTRLRQIFFNIISNAIKFTSPQGSVHLDLALEEACAGSGDPMLKFQVIDTGCGISEEQQTKLFHPFTQGDPSYTRQYGGTGLGLSLARRLARALDGDIWLERSAVGVGSVFCGQVSVALTAEEKRGKAADMRPDQGQGRPKACLLLADLRLLLVEDQPDLRMLIKQDLVLAGAYVDLANNGLEALQMTLVGNYSLVIMDIQMPVLDGFQAVDQLRRRGYRQPILALTAHAMPEDRELCLNAGFNAHLSKPFKSRELIEAIAQLCH